MQKRTTIAIPDDIHKGLVAHGYKVSTIAAKLLSQFMEDNNIPKVVQQDQDRQAA